jgi:hypothetical protein
MYKQCTEENRTKQTAKEDKNIKKKRKEKTKEKKKKGIRSLKNKP